MSFENPSLNTEAQRPSAEVIHQKAESFITQLKEFKRQDWEREYAWEAWTKDEIFDEDTDEEIRKEHYPGWKKEDFAQLLDLYREGEAQVKAEWRMNEIRRSLGANSDAPIEELVQKLQELNTVAIGTKKNEST